MPLSRTIGRLVARYGVVLDSVLVAGGNSLTLLVGARVLGLGELVTLTLFQFYVTLGVGLQRATFLNPSLAVRSLIGRNVGPAASWVLQISLPLAAFAFAPVALGLGEASPQTFAIAALGSFAVLAHDCLRFVLLASGRVKVNLAVSTVWLLLVTLGLCLAQTWAQFALAWTLPSVVAVGALAGGALAGRTGDVAPIRQTLSLGAFSGLDSAMAGAAGLLPILVTTFQLASTDAAVYRVLQVTVGPLNVLSAAMLTMAGLGAAQSATAEGRRIAASVARTRSWQLAILSGCATAASAPIVLVASGFPVGPNAVPLVVTVLAATFAAATSPLVAATSAFGGQRFGVVVRVVVLAISVSVTVNPDIISWSSVGPIGFVTICASALGYVGWTVALRMQLRRRNTADSIGKPEVGSVG